MVVRSRLIVSFIGNADLKYFPPQDDDCSPVLRLLLALPQIKPFVPYERTRLLILDDDADGQKRRQEFCEQLQKTLPALGIGGLKLESKRLIMPQGPTDLNALYEQTFAAIPVSRDDRADETLFHLSSGTFSMQATLLLAANCLRLERVRLFETSKEKGAREIKPPYVLAARDRRVLEGRKTPRLPEKARHVLAPDTVIEDPRVESAYAALYKATAAKAGPSRVLVQGPTGSGKWHACRQFALWRKAASQECLTPVLPDEVFQGATLLLHRLDNWPETALHTLTIWAAQRPDVAIVASYRTDQPPRVPLDVMLREGLRGAIHVELPALGTRCDLVKLGEALARRLGLADGKLKKRLHYEWMTDVYPRNLHDLARLLASANVHSPGLHLEHEPYIRVRDLTDSRALLEEAWQILSSLDFSPGRHKLDEVLDAIRAAIVLGVLAEERSQEEAGKRLGLSQQTISDVKNGRLNLSRWQSRHLLRSEPGSGREDA